MTEPEQPMFPKSPAAPPTEVIQPAVAASSQPTPPGYVQPPAPGYGQVHAVGGPGSIGKVRGTGVAILLIIVTFGIYSIYWYYSVHEEMKRHRGTGLGGGIALILALFVGFVMPYLTSSEVGDLYAARGQQKPVSGATGLWYFPGIFILVGPIVWFVKTNGAINAYWQSVGAA